MIRTDHDHDSPGWRCALCEGDVPTRPWSDADGETLRLCVGCSALVAPVCSEKLYRSLGILVAHVRGSISRVALGAIREYAAEVARKGAEEERVEAAVGGELRLEPRRRKP